MANEFEFDDVLKAVAIEGEDSNQLASDLPICSFFDSYSLIPIFLFILTLVFSVTFPSLHQVVMDNQKIENDLKSNTIKSSITELSPQNQFLTLFLKFPDLDLFKIRSFDISFKLTTDSHKFELPSTKFENIQNDKIVPIFFTTNVNFTYSNLELTLSSLPQTPVSIIWETRNLKTTKYLLSIRLCWFLCSFLYFYNLLMKLIAQGFKSLTTTQILTIPLMLLFVLYIFPLSILIPSNRTVLFETIFKDLYFAYILFYSMTIYTYIIEKSMESSYQYYILPYFLFITYFVYWIGKDIQLFYPTTDFILPSFTYQVQPSFSDSVFLSVFFLILFIWMVGFSRLLKPLQETRFKYYLMINVGAFVYFVTYMILVHFANLTTAATSVLPLIGFSFYTILMADGQFDIEEMQYAMTNHPIIDVVNNQIGIDPA